MLLQPVICLFPNTDFMIPETSDSVWREAPHVGRLNIRVEEIIALFLCISVAGLSVKTDVTWCVFICICEHKNANDGVVG